MIHITLTGQNYYDIALQLFGSVENLYDILVENDLSSDDLPAAGDEIVYDNRGKGDEVIKAEISRYLYQFVSGGSATVPSTAAPPAVVQNSDGSWGIIIPSGITYTLPDTTVNVYVDGVLNATGTIVTLGSDTINITA